MCTKKITNTAYIFPLPIQDDSNHTSHNKKQKKQSPNGNCYFLVRETGLEPVRVAPHAPQTCASADSATLASTVRSITEQATNVNTFFEFF